VKVGLGPRLWVSLDNPQVAKVRQCDLGNLSREIRMLKNICGFGQICIVQDHRVTVPGNYDIEFDSVRT
jgi:hypothetical protein